MIRIESRANPTYKSISALRQTGRSRQAGLVFLEGSRLCLDAIASGAEVRYALVADFSLEQMSDVLDSLANGTEIISLPDALFARLCDTKTPQGIALVCRSPLLDRPAGPPENSGLYLIAEGVSDPGNLGTMIRTADAFAFDAVLVTDGTVYPLNDKVMRAAMGSCFHIPLLAMTDIQDCLSWLSGTRASPALVAADLAGSDLLPAAIEQPTALVIGNEARGLSDQARAACTHRVGIEMPGRAESLNAASAAAILSHDLMRIRARGSSSVI